MERKPKPNLEFLPNAIYIAGSGWVKVLIGETKVNKNAGKLFVP